MKLTINPYNPELIQLNLFYGRHKLIDQVNIGLDSVKSYAICGGRRMGKTTVLRYIEAERKGKRDCVYLDLKSHLLSVEYPIDLFNVLLSSSLSLVLDNSRFTLLTNINDIKDFEINLSEIIKLLPSKQITILIDESDTILEKSWGKDFFSFLRSLVSNSSISDSFGVVISGGRKLRDLARLGGSPFNIATWCYLEPFNFEDTSALVIEPTGIKVPDQLIDRLHQYSGGHPYILQFLLHDIISNAVGFSADSVALAEQRFYTTQAFQMRSWWLDLEEEDKELYRFLFSKDFGVDLATCSTGTKRMVQENMEGLISFGLVRYDSEINLYYINCDVFKNWFINNIPELALLPEGMNSGHIISPDTPHTNIVNLRNIIRELKEYIHWIDPHFGYRAFEELNICADPDQISDIKILSREDSISEKAKREYERFKEELTSRGIEVEWRTYPKGNLRIHDRYLIGANAIYNVPPVNSIYQGVYAEILPTSYTPPFAKWWEVASPI
ncbi:AAA-like domain-containing protein [Chloroflexota bacterium]